MNKHDEIVNDRISPFLIPKIDRDYLFDELSDDYLKKAEVYDILKGVPVPIKKSELSGMSNVSIARNMCFVMGCDPGFMYNDNYIRYIEKTFTRDFSKPMINEGVELAAKDEYEDACALFRAALMLDPESTDALYCYGRACKDCYENGSGEEYVGNFKAESLTAFERLTLKAPDHDMGFYFLGFGYANMGLYIKAKLTWERFMELSSQGELRAEVRGYLDQLDHPVKIEEGYNRILSGRFEEGIEILSPYCDDQGFSGWWPLWHYLGVGYMNLQAYEEAEKSFLKVLTISPGSMETMEQLVELYRLMGENEKADKYQRKMEIVEENREKDREERMKDLPGNLS